MKGSDLFVKCLENESVEYIFGIPGEETADFMMSLSKSKKIKFIPTRHEQGAAFMADVYGRLTQKPGVCLGTLGPGATNLITGVADANLDRAPLVAITGQSGLATTHKESHQYIDITQTFKSITKWNKTITRANFIPEIIRKAFKTAATEKPGATHVELPEDIAEEKSDAAPLPIETKSDLHKPGRVAVDEAARLIKKSKFPIILAGNGVIRGNASKRLLAFAKKNNIPVASTFMGKGTISHKEKLSLGTVGLQSEDYTLCGFYKADLIITVGYDLVEYSPSKWNPLKDKKIIHIDTTHVEIDEYYQTAVDLIGIIDISLKHLMEKTGYRKNFEYSLKMRDFMIDELRKYSKDSSFPVKPQKLIHDMRSALKPEDILISDVGAHKMWISRLYPTYKPNTVIISNGLASMGIAVPGALAAKLVHPKKKIIAATGDGGFLMNMQELETAKRLKLNFVVVIFTDSTYGVIEWNQMKKFNKTFGTKFTNPDFVKLAESFGCKGVKIKKTADLKKYLDRALKDKNIWVIDVPVDYSENLKLTKKLGANICQI